LKTGARISVDNFLCGVKSNYKTKTNHKRKQNKTKRQAEEPKVDQIKAAEILIQRI
jgi:hypothetical protein